ncbi:hypothetical protein N0V91_001156 [Didymella pomorum]|uniref:Uncharacterized protein n=1 Tax=Didymella pomorum TaxID=749634 RepID=A0A9W8ZM93_9PLEO|nr:hypothetical protein N0V91_001156 [Didymella pomorum]
MSHCLPSQDDRSKFVAFEINGDSQEVESRMKLLNRLLGTNNRHECSTVNEIHLFDLVHLVLRIVLYNAERIDPEKLLPDFSDETDRISNLWSEISESWLKPVRLSQVFGGSFVGILTLHPEVSSSSEQCKERSLLEEGKA